MKSNRVQQLKNDIQQLEVEAQFRNSMIIMLMNEANLCDLQVEEHQKVVDNLTLKIRDLKAELKDTI